MGMSIEEAIKVLEQHHMWTGEPQEIIDVRVENSAMGVAIDTMRKYQQLEDFAKWVAVEVIDEDMWTYNHLSFAELACRKLVKLGIMQESDGEYTYEVIEDGNG